MQSRGWFPKDFSWFMVSFVFPAWSVINAMEMFHALQRANPWKHVQVLFFKDAFRCISCLFMLFQVREFLE